jgi:hypothetical protein
MPSREVYEEFLRRGIRVDRDPYCRYDRLESREDMAKLFEVLQSVKDCKGNPAIVTANAVTANPVFDKIKASGFKEYHYEPFTETYHRYPNHTKTHEMWQEDSSIGIFS